MEGLTKGSSAAECLVGWGKTTIDTLERSIWAGTKEEVTFM